MKHFLIIVSLILAAVPGCGDVTAGDLDPSLQDSGVDWPPFDPGDPDAGIIPDSTTDSDDFLDRDAEVDAAPPAPDAEGEPDSNIDPPAHPDPKVRCPSLLAAPSFFRSISYYGATGASLAALQGDFQKFAYAGICNVRIWTEWGVPVDDVRVFDKNGNVRPNRMKRLVDLVSIAGSYNVSVDLTMSRPLFNSLAAHIKAAKSLAMQFKGNPAVAFFDLCNEHEGKINADQYRQIAEAVIAIDPDRKLTASTSGQVSFIASKYAEILKATPHIHLLTPHFPRVKGWGAKEGPNAKQLANLLGNMGTTIPPIYLQEPARNAYQGQYYPLSEFVDADKSARASGVTGICFHTGAGFDLLNKPLFDQFDSVEMNLLLYFYNNPL
jgi:hypothetical protein